MDRYDPYTDKFIKDATDKNVGTTDARQAFMDIVYAELASDPDNNRANRIIDAADEYVESTQLGPNLAEVGTRTVRGYPIDADALMEKVAEEYGERARDTLYRIIRDMPPAQQNLSEEYAKAVRNWLVNYQIKCAELKGRYTPYEVLGWIVSDWRKENGIW